MKYALIFTIMASPAFGATITADDMPPTMGGLKLKSELTRVGGPCGTGRSVTGNGCQTVIKSDPNAPHAFGRSNPKGGSWADSQDGTKFKWKVSSPKKFDTMSFALTDAFDQKKHKDFGKSYFEMRSKGASWKIDSRQKNGTTNWITVKLRKAVNTLSMTFSTRQNDGFGVSSARGVCR